MAIKKVSKLPSNFMYTNAYTEFSEICISGYDLDTKQKVYYRTDTVPELAAYVKSDKPTKFKSLKKGIPLQPKYFNDIKSYRKFVKSNSVSGFKIFGEHPFHFQALYQHYKNKPVEPDFTLVNVGLFDIETEIEDSFPYPEEAAQRISAITVACSKSRKLYILALKDFVDSARYEKLISNLKKEIVFTQYSFELMTYGNCESDLLLDFCTIINEIEMIDIISAWNSKFFDVAYLYFRFNKVFGEEGANILSPYGKTTMREGEDPKTKKKEYIVNIHGITHIDYMIAFKKYFYKPLESYRLDFVTKYILDRGKVDHEGSLKKLYEEDYENFIYYNATDTNLLVELEQKKKIIWLMMVIAFDCLMNFDEPMSPVKTWHNLIYNELTPKGICSDPKTNMMTKDMKYPGAYVHRPSPGFKRYVVTFDYDSMYPHIFMGWCASPETLLEDEDVEQMFGHDEKAMSTIRSIWEIRNNLPYKEKHLKTYTTDEDGEEVEGESQEIGEAWDVLVHKFEKREFDLSFLKGTNICASPAGEFFIKNKDAVIPKLMNQKYAGRKTNKLKQIEYEKQLENCSEPKEASRLRDLASLYFIRQTAEKIVLNAGYGAFASVYNRYADIRIPRVITCTGRYAIRTVSNYISKKLNEKFKTNNDYRVYNDTDAADMEMWVVVEDFVKKHPNSTKEERIDYLDKFINNEVLGWIDEHANETAEYFNAYKSLKMKREVIADVGIWLDLRKHYILREWDSEGIRFKHPEIMVKGTSFVKSSMPKMCRDKFKQFMGYLIDLYDSKGEDIYNNHYRKQINNYVKDFKEQFIKTNILTIASSSGVNNIEQYDDGQGGWIKGAPWNVKASITYNNYILDNKLKDSGYELISSGNKMKAVFLIPNNPYGNDCFAFINKLPPGFDLRYIDYDKTFERSFLTVAQTVLTSLGFEINLRNEAYTEDDFMC